MGCVSIRHLRRVLAITGVIAFVWAPLARAEARGPQEADRPWWHGQSFYLASGYASAVGLRKRTIGKDVRDVSYVPVILGWSVPVGPVLGGDHWLAGRFELGLEAQILAEVSPQSGVGGGAVFDARYHFRPRAALRPYLEAGLGIVGLDFGLKSQADGLAFVIQGGVGLQHRLSPRIALELALRYHHLSNAQSQFPNEGIDAFMGVAAVRFFPE
jgi:hypothetical protein